MLRARREALCSNGWALCSQLEVLCPKREVSCASCEVRSYVVTQLRSYVVTLFEVAGPPARGGMFSA